MVSRKVAFFRRALRDPEAPGGLGARLRDDLLADEGQDGRTVGSVGSQGMGGKVDGRREPLAGGVSPDRGYRLIADDDLLLSCGFHYG